ncbi:universal stress protein [Flavilitoribacter nigricans]|uniref:UspA domain-containing protein n=1 Tax=Flavilitoribacter nigricans (strain ATCC 23147 / DSM 23189 / NBRC 102662 / NCIMB 1420 / SS-2) TaxID=1122177 RepID=A0A2D0NE37_FLAN2|nr:universal stress protein [Flavilitoribacter nigricans]PHN06033.1 hypothetical protein CRP01_13770 [Flavilitoribacter nigricans DSM 23189 = NBRC 102662]
MKKILLPTDGTELGDYAYELAHKIAQKTKASIEVLTVVPAPAGAIFDPDGRLRNDEGEDFSDFYEEKVAVEERLERWIEDKPDIRYTNVRIGHIEEDILQYVKNNQVDLVVMGTKGAHGMNEFIRGSHTGHIVNASPVPVLCLKCDRSGMLIHDILLLSDFEEVEQLDLGILKDLLYAFDAELHLLRVNTPKHFATTRQVKRNMERFVELNGLDKVRFHIYDEESIEQGITNFSLENRVDIVAIGTHQRKGFDRLFKHSVSEDIVNHLMQPVLTFRV